MKVYNPIGSKERFLEMFQRVNKIQLNEEMVQGNAGTNVLETAFNDLKNNTLNIKRTDSQTTGDENFIEINGVDNSGNDITFRFRVTVNQGEEEGVIGIENAELINFEYKSRTYDMEVPEGMNMLRQFNAKHGNEIADVVGEYADFDSGSQANDELYEEAIKLIDKVPYNKGSEEMQTQKAYFDQKPTNPDVRVNAPELQKFVKEEEELDPFALPPDYSGGNFKDVEDIEEPVSDEPEEEASPEEMELMNQAFNNLLTRNKSRRNPNYYPTRPELEKEMQRLRPQEPPKEDPDSHMAQGKKRVYPAWADKYLAEQHPMDAANVVAKSYDKLSPEKRSEIIRKAVEIVDEKLGVKKYQMPKEHYLEIVRQFALQIYHHGLHTDDTHMFGIKDMNETDYPKDLEIGKEFSTGSKYPKPKKHRIKKTKIKTGVDEGEEIEGDEEETNDGMSLEPKGDEVAQLAQDKEETGEILQGGKGDGKSPLEFDPDQIIKGMEVEKEHTDDPMAAIEIVLDHLSEDPEYYTVKDTPEASAQAGASADASGEDIPHASGAYLQDGMAGELDRNGNSIPAVCPDFLMNPDMGMGSPAELARKMGWLNNDKEKTDALLGYKPKNVGDGVDEAMIGASNATSAVGSPVDSEDDEQSDEMKKYNEYKSKDVNSLNDTQKKEYFDLWTKYEPKKTE
jgi:hypothetical protein